VKIKLLALLILALLTLGSFIVVSAESVKGESSNSTIAELNNNNTDSSTFESLRSELKQSYDSQVTNHAGYFVTILIGISAVIVTRDFNTLFKKHRLLLIFAVAFLLSSLAYFGYRLVYWSWMGTEVLLVTSPQATINNQTSIFGIQNYLNGNFTAISKSDNYGLFYRTASFFYNIDQQWFIPFSFLIVLASSYFLSYCKVYYWLFYKK
jgi:hypothetical protein